jgi:S1-C subfamily serine protease
MERRGYWILGCVIVLLIACVVVIVGGALFVWPAMTSSRSAVNTVETSIVERASTRTPVPQATIAPHSEASAPTAWPRAQGSTADADLVTLYQQLNPGVVSIQVYVQRGDASGQGAGSGFIVDDRGYIVTNNHVVSGATQVIVVFYEETEVEAEVVGTDADSDLAVLKVSQVPDGAHSLPLGDSDQVQEGESVVAIGNPFGYQSSMTAGIVSAVGRTLPSGLTAFSIPNAIQTDAPINPGNSGGPLLNLRGEVIGVNAQIRTDGTSRSNSGVGFAIPVNVVRQVIPSLIERGAYQWPWLGIEGTSVNLFIAQANGLDSQQGAYISNVLEDGPSLEAGLQGSTGLRQVSGLQVPVGGDVVIEADGQPVRNFSDLLYLVALKHPGEVIRLTVLRDGQQQQIDVTLQPRPSNLEQ